MSERPIRRIAVVGSRDYPNLEEVRQYIREQERDVVIISGGARGVDSVAIEEARKLRVAYEIYPADWQHHGRSAGIRRNRTIVDKCTELIAFWDGKSLGTATTIAMVKQSKKPYRVVKPLAAFEMTHMDKRLLKQFNIATE